MFVGLFILKRLGCCQRPVLVQWLLLRLQAGVRSGVGSVDIFFVVAVGTDAGSGPLVLRSPMTPQASRLSGSQDDL